jgi:ubiquinone/menaquinone biosynthesis C-methylase UbiE
MATPSPQPGPALDPQVLMHMHFSFVPQRVLAAAVELGVFTQMAEGHRTATEIAQACEANERGMRMLLDSLTVLELVAKKDGAYELAPLSAEFLVREKPNYVGYAIGAKQLWEPWDHLADAVRTGKAPMTLDNQEDAEEYFPYLVRSLHVMHREPARRLAAALGAGSTHRGLRVLDIACGSGIWGISVAEADPEARVTAQDFPGMLRITRGYTKQHGVDNRYDYLAGDLKQTDFGKGRYDLAILGHIVHSEGAYTSRDLFRRVRRALRPGGRIAIMDMIPNDERTGPPFQVFFALNMLVHTTEGDTFTLAEYRAWLKEAGFEGVETVDIATQSPAIVATRR